jgi:hypothetical protein
VVREGIPWASALYSVHLLKKDFIVEAEVVVATVTMMMMMKR